MPTRGNSGLWAALALCTLGVAPGGATADSAPRPKAPLVRLTRADAWYGLATVGTVVGIGQADEWFRERAMASDGVGTRRLARSVRPFGAPQVLGPALLLAYAGGRVFARPDLSAASVRVGASVMVAGTAAAALKIGVGRVRPRDVDQETDRFQPFSRHHSFPSGHATLAFAAAAALDQETTAGWVPWVSYPIALLVGWSRVQDDEHWASDVVAGAALGFWTARKTDEALRVHARQPGRVGLVLRRDGEHLRLAARVSF
jgi:PAP2 superfamily protein